MGYDSGSMNGQQPWKMGGQQQQPMVPFAGSGGMPQQQPFGWQNYGPMSQFFANQGQPLGGQPNFKMGGQEQQPIMQAAQSVLQAMPSVSPTQPAQMSVPPPAPMAYSPPPAQIQPQNQMMMSPQQLQTNTQNLLQKAAGTGANAAIQGPTTSGFYGNQANMQNLIGRAG